MSIINLKSRRVNQFKTAQSDSQQDISPTMDNYRCEVTVYLGFKYQKDGQISSVVLSLKQASFHTLRDKLKCLSQVTGEDARCHLQIVHSTQEAGGGSPDTRVGSCLACVAWEHHQTCGGQPGKDSSRELRNAPAVQIRHTARDLKVNKKIVEENMTCEKQALLNTLSNRNTMWTPFSLGELLQTFSDQIPKAEVQERQWFSLPVVVVFLNKGREAKSSTWA